jgi:carboxyl-terminal processing protease
MVVMAGIGFAAGLFVDQPSALVPATGRETATGTPPQVLNVDLIAEAHDVIQDNYADREALEDTDLTYAAISGMVDALGDTGHSRFLTPDMVAAEQRAISGELEGIGALLQIKDDLPVILAPMDNSPAQRAGLQPGDIILEVDGEDVTQRSLTEIVSRVTGPAGTDVTLTIQNPETDEVREVTITRARIDIQNVTWQMLPGTSIAHVRIASFSQDVANNLRSALRDAKRQGAESVILDLRNNPGGLLSQAIGVTSQFLAEGNALIQKDAQGETREVPVRAGGVATDLPLVVLINQGSASAAEIVAGALQDYERATLVGETTFGTGTVLLTFPLDDGSAVLLATELWLTPKGRVIWHEGIPPDVAVEMPANVSPSIPETERDLTPEGLDALDDTQLKRAIEILQE